MSADDVGRAGHRHAPAEAMKIGPNAITQLHRVLLDRLGEPATRELFSEAGIAGRFANPPEAMVDEHEVARLHGQVRLRLERGQAREVMTEAGDATGRYILANRIPAPIAWLLRRLPASLSSPLLEKAIQRHAWTFAGSGSFAIGPLADGPERVLVARIAANPVVALERADHPICDWHAAVFRRLFRDLVDPEIEVEEIECCAMGNSSGNSSGPLNGNAAGTPACRFTIRRPR